MHVFVATPLTQGTQPDDHYCCLDGEIVIWDTAADVEHEPGDLCECSTGFFGAYTGGRSTTALVADDPEVTELDLLEIVRRALLDETGSDRDAASMARTVSKAAARFTPGDVVERHRTQLTPRWVSAGLSEWAGHSHPAYREAE